VRLAPVGGREPTLTLEGATECFLRLVTDAAGDVEDGEIYGVGSTPTIFVNGVQLRILSAEGLKAAIDNAASAPKTSSTQ